ncbi:MAG: penicillin acylase family protein [Candidatus Competibacteraceae bacterium]
MVLAIGIGFGYTLNCKAVYHNSTASGRWRIVILQLPYCAMGGRADYCGANRLDLARATGFLHARDRFFQMDLLRRVAAGEL